MNGRRVITSLLMLGALALATTGCVSKDEYDKAATAARLARQELESVNGRYQAAMMENKDLKEKNGILGSQIALKDQAIAQQKGMIDKLQGDLAAANKALADAWSKEPTVIVKGGANALPDKLNDIMVKLALEFPDLFEWDARLGMLRVKADLTFAPGSTEIKPEAVKALTKLADVLNRPDFHPFNSYIAGHTDDMPLSKEDTKALHGSNWGLSVHRSLAVIKLLAENKVDQARMGALGFSKYQPVAANAAGGKGNAANRRVEIWIVPKEKFMTTAIPGAPTVSAEKEGT